MYCANCRAEVRIVDGYCAKCGAHLNARLCPNGHIMDPSWTECQYCPPTARGRPAGAPGGLVGPTGTAVESFGKAPGVPPGGFAKGATLIENTGSPGGHRRDTVAEPGPLKGRTVADSGLPGSSAKKDTTFDPGVSRSAEPAAVPASRAKLVGWLLTFDHDPAGTDFHLREGRNTIGTDREASEVCLEWDGTVSGKHAVIVFRDGKFQIRDCDSVNGTYVNGEDIFGKEGVVLTGGDRIKIGASTFRLYVI